MIAMQQKRKTLITYIKLIFKDSSFLSITIILKQKNTHNNNKI